MRERHLPAACTAAVVGRCALVLLWISASHALLADEVRVRIAWGGGTDRVWHGTISVSEGALSNPQPLGVEADEPGSMWLDGDPAASRKLWIEQRSARGYDGVDVLVAAPASAKLRVQLSASDDSSPGAAVEIPLKEVNTEFVNKELDNRGNRLLLMRTPGDSLRVSPARDCLVFAPGDTLKFSLEPRSLPLAEGGRARIKIQLLAGNKELWAQQHDIQNNGTTKIPVEITLPGEEGVYDVAIAAINNPNWSQAVRQPLNWKRTIAERRVQLVVLSSQRPAAPRADRELTQVVEIDPANPRWYEKLNKLPQLQLAKTRFPRLWKGPLGNDCLRTRPHALGELAQLNANTDSPDVSWEAYWLPITQPGRPHIVEVDYPSDVPQTLGISVVEPNAAGALSPIGLDSGLDSAPEAVGSAGTPRWQRHRVVFWPRTATPMLLMTNGREHSPAVYGKIRVLMAGEQLARLAPERTGGNRRLMAAYLDRPLIPENFSADECLDPWSGRSLDDWWTFYEGGTRLVEYLHYAGYNGLMLGVVADGSTIYPSKQLSPTPRYDTGVFFATGQDPVRKDVLEMLLRLFDREDLQLIPAVEFASPLPELEAIRRIGGPDAQGIEWIGADGTSWCAASAPQRGLAPYYNVLDPRVQQAMLGVLREIAQRYARHPAFAGLAVRLSADGYAQLAGPEWGLDDATIAQFERDAKLSVPGKGPQRFAERATFLAEDSHRRAWIEWRAAQLTKFYQRVHDELAAIRPGSRLYLAGAGMIGGPELEADLRPTLPRRTTIASALMRVGVDARQYQDDQRQIVLLRPERILPQTSLASRAAELEIARMADFDRYFQTTGAPGSLFFHAPREVRVESFDAKSPFKSSYLWLVSQPALAGDRNRQRFVHSLATLDAQVMVDGGWLLPIGQEESVRNLMVAYRALPATRFRTVGNKDGTEVSQPITFRTATHGGRTYLYAVNDAPFRTTGWIHVDAGQGCRIEELSGTRKVPPLRPDAERGLCWEVAMEPYDMVAVQLSEPNAQFSNPRATWPGEVETALSTQIRKLGARTAALRNPPSFDAIGNPGFEKPTATDSPIPNWIATLGKGVDIELQKTPKHEGQQSVRLSSTGPVACLVSQPFCPCRRRAAFRCPCGSASPNADKQPPLRLALGGKYQGRDYYRFAPIGLPPGGGPSPTPIAAEWRPYVFQVDDLPLEGLTSVRVRFDLMGAGEGLDRRRAALEPRLQQVGVRRVCRS